MKIELTEKSEVTKTSKLIHLSVASRVIANEQEKNLMRYRNRLAKRYSPLNIGDVFKYRGKVYLCLDISGEIEIIRLGSLSESPLEDSKLRLGVWIHCREVNPAILSVNNAVQFEVNRKDEIQLIDKLEVSRDYPWLEPIISYYEDLRRIKESYTDQDEEEKILQAKQDALTPNPCSEPEVTQGTSG